MSNQNVTIASVAEDIAKRIPAMNQDGQLNNEQLIAGLIEPLVVESEHGSNVFSTLFLVTLGMFLGFFIAIAIGAYIESKQNKHNAQHPILRH